ncbi:MAG TPA: SsrA-binding protein SmpB [Patescibacteria group bacterium]|nr:SsrA-binding protein SmpB [Patescibacteria group bacterium]
MKVENKRAFFNYFIEERIEAGVVLTGGEARAIREGHINLSNAYAKILSNEVYLVNAVVPITGAKNYNQSRSRKLLLKRSEIIALETKMKQKKLTLVPTKVYTKQRLVKVELGLAKAKHEYEKKESLKQKDIERDIEMNLKN